MEFNPRPLEDTSGYDATKVISTLHEAHAYGKYFAGLIVEDGSVWIWESLIFCIC